MMHMKAKLFNDRKSERLILNSNEPKEQKKLGRKVIGFDSSKWNEVKYDLIKKGLREKYNQNPDLKELLTKNNDCIFVEASPYDRIWGIGFNENTVPLNINNWGENLLGKILTELSNELK